MQNDQNWNMIFFKSLNFLVMGMAIQFRWLWWWSFWYLANLDLTNAQILFCARINFFNQYLLQLRLYENAETLHCIQYWKQFWFKISSRLSMLRDTIAIVSPHFVYRSSGEKSYTTTFHLFKYHTLLPQLFSQFFFFWNEIRYHTISYNLIQ